MKKISVLLLFCLFSASEILGQAEINETYNFLTFRPRFIQIKDAFNYGFVYNGLNIGLEYSYELRRERRIISLKSEFDFGVSYKKGLGLDFSFKPLELYYGFKLTQNVPLSIILGPYSSGIYKWQFYPELQSGHMYWVSSWEIGPGIIVLFPYKGRMISGSFNGSVLALNSRPILSTETYFYSLKLKDFIKNPNSNMKFGSQDVYTHIKLILGLANENRRLSFGYEFEYLNYRKPPVFRFISHSVNMKWRIGKVKQK